MISDQGLLEDRGKVILLENHLMADHIKLNLIHLTVKLVQTDRQIFNLRLHLVAKTSFLTMVDCSVDDEHCSLALKRRGFRFLV